MRRRWSLLASSMLLALAGCTTTPAVRGPVGDLAALAQWQANGRIAVAGAAGGGSGSFQWEQTRAASEIGIRGPIGVGSLRVRLDVADPERMQLQLADGRELQSDAARAELEARLGAPVPVEKLRYWLLGLAAPGEHEWLAQEERSTVLLQDGWRIEFLAYGEVQGQRTPSRITATHGPARIKLLIDRWRLGDAADGR